jgi:hypothetical protein
VVRVERAFVSVQECLGQRLEGTFGAEPGEVVFEMAPCRGENGLRTCPYEGIQPIRADDEIAVKRLQTVERASIGKLRPGHSRPALENVEQFEAADSGETDAVEQHRLAAMDKRHVAPALHARRHQIVRLRIVGAQEVERLVGKHHAKAKGRVRRILLPYPHAATGHRFADQDRGVEPGRSGSDNVDQRQGYQTRLPSCLVRVTVYKVSRNMQRIS